MATAQKKSPQEKTVDRSAAKVENFKRLANKRVSRALKTLSGVAALGNRNSYTYDDAQVKKITDALDAKLKVVKDAFGKGAATVAEDFTV